MNTIYDANQIGLNQMAVLEKDGVQVTSLVKWVQASIGNLVNYKDAWGKVTKGWTVLSINTPLDPTPMQRHNGNLRKKQIAMKPGKVTITPRL